ncbi:xylanase [Pseudoxanthomonas suwonensis]|uniref:Xylanase n=1 Tax=Pseudoxanthomonas suwonensis TaxID=314722 RepID=A0A0E3Z450_9GAMM|nr:xylanase [Pseudoxanthomonas suwonensis]
MEHLIGASRRARGSRAWLLFVSVAAALPAFAAPAPVDGAAAPVQVPLWPGPAPGSQGLSLAQRIVERSADPALPDRYADGIAAPSLTVYRPAHPDGRALLVVPGGGYQRVVLDKEGTALVPAFAEAGGLTLFVLQYRLPGEGHRDARDVPLADTQRAMRLIRRRAAEWGVDAGSVGVMGFSAGGHVAASLATRHREQVYAPVDAADGLDARPAYVLLVYPVIDMGAHAHPGSRQELLGDAPDAASVRAYSLQNRVDAATPPVFLLHAQDDDVVPVENSLLFEAALREAGIGHETHLYAHGGHGFGVRAARGTLALWPQLALAWIHEQAPPGPARMKD